MNKNAVDLKGLRAAFKNIKPHLIRRNITQNGRSLFSKKFKTKGPSYIEDMASKLKKLGLDDISELKIINDKPTARVYQSLADKIFAKSSLRKIVQKQKGINGSRMEYINGFLTPKQKEMLNRIILMHEHVERKVKPSFASSWLNHRSPEIILKENNIIASLKGDGQPVRDIFKKMRKHENREMKKLIPDFEYGEKKYNRRFIKGFRSKINEVMKQKDMEIKNTLKKARGE